MTSVPFEMYTLIHNIAADLDLSLVDIEDRNQTTLMAVQPFDLLTNNNPGAIRVEGFFQALIDKRAELPMSVHIEMQDRNGSMLPFQITKNLPGREHLIVISTLE